MARKPFYSQDQRLRLGPNSYDCSGLIWAAYNAAGVSVGFVVSQQMQAGQKTACTLADVRQDTCVAPGDVLILAGFCGTPACHASIYVGGGYVADCLNESDGCKL